MIEISRAKRIQDFFDSYYPKLKISSSGNTHHIYQGWISQIASIKSGKVFCSDIEFGSVLDKQPFITKVIITNDFALLK